MKTTQPRDIPTFLNSSKPVYTHTQYYRNRQKKKESKLEKEREGRTKYNRRGREEQSINEEGGKNKV